MTSAPGDPDTLYVVEQPGTIRIVRNGKIAGTFLDIRSLVVSGGEQGLLSMAFSPHYASNHLFYVSYTNVDGDSRVVRYRSANGVGVRSSARILLGVNQPYANHNGGLLMFDKRGYLYFGLGDGGSGGDPQQHAQNMRSRLGKLLRSRSKSPGTRWKTVGLGLRNPWRFSFDSANDNLWLGDVGQDRYEEIDFRRASKLDKLANYGWSRYEGYSVYDSSHRYANTPRQGASGDRVLARPRLLGHGRLRLSRQRRSGRRAAATSTATTAPARSGASASASTAAPQPLWCRATCRRSRRSAWTGTASCTQPRWTARSTSSIRRARNPPNRVRRTNHVASCSVAGPDPRRGGRSHCLR